MTRKKIQKKSGKTPITPFRLPADVRAELERSSKAEGRSMNDVVADRVLGRDRFTPAVEAMIAEYSERHNCGRKEAVQSLLIEAIQRISEREAAAGRSAAVTPELSEVFRRMLARMDSLEQELKRREDGSSPRPGGKPPGSLGSARE